mmetsp:Transcript_81854/g.171209  ORF Transcript_81854/g.171209 Transcript_81854/m.171209 type:complete len:428 (+) Transcript_81854:357-1640(+)|eukprot:CAMPEP_0206454454 /NCGR_PEP_ID=MMETSP0324_2-20121206/21145_1 /ASSEMBLY_ACC=CAM_ASM_000836 /TAXON_ID=2866 /ORGANISM="Crypthecodinium cohnii, Strain Seligo" /LENGTH=427 /DNA_ID=CAMNT_0053924927 /DNA_START=370 /DNA_END=1653 /DNA_ORIENTATION=+
MVSGFPFGKLLKRRRPGSSSTSPERSPRKTPRNGKHQCGDAAPFGADTDVVFFSNAEAKRLSKTLSALGGCRTSHVCEAPSAVPGEVFEPTMDSDFERTTSTATSTASNSHFDEMPEEDEAMHMRWSSALRGRTLEDLKSEELQQLLADGDIPLKYRHALWPKWFIELPQSTDIDSLQGEVSLEVAAQIEADITRTRPQQIGPLERRSLRRVLRALSALNPSVGYCQGMNNIAVVFLLLGFDEFTSLRGCFTLLQKCCPNYHSTDLAGLRQDAQVLNKLVETHLTPKLRRSLADLGVPMEVLVSQQLLTLGSFSWPLTAIVRYWDLLLQDGSSAVFASVLALLRLYLPGKQEVCTKPTDKIMNWSKDVSFHPYIHEDEEEEEEPIEGYRRRVAAGVQEHFAEVMQEVRRLLPEMKLQEIDELRRSQA